MKSLLAFLVVCFLACITPLFVGIVDAYWYIFTDAQATSINWHTGKALMAFTFAMFGTGIFITWMKDIAEEIEDERDEHT